MKTLIIYGSQYGSTKRYAKHLSETTGIEAVDYKQVKNLEGFDRIIFMGGFDFHVPQDGIEDTRIATDSRCQSHA